ncbi:unnamed protein product [Effrenium voratum]|nr:unnamed protein product [Effrenium voratum]
MAGWQHAAEALEGRTLLAAICAQEEWEKALSLHATMWSPNLIVHNALCRRLPWRAGLSLTHMARRLEPDIISYNSMVHTCDKARQWQQALRCLRGARTRLLEATVITCCSAMSACLALAWHCTLQIAAEMQRCFLQPDDASSNLLTAAFAKAHAWANAIGSSGVTGLNVAMAAYVRASERHKALDLFARSTSHDLVTYNTALHACAMGGWWQLALELLRRARRRRLRANAVSCTAAVDACARATKWQHALGLFSVSRATPAMNALLAHLHWDVALELAASSEPDLTTWNLLLSARGASWQMVSWLLPRAERLGADHFTWTAAALMLPWPRSLALLGMPGLAPAAAAAVMKTCRWRHVLQVLRSFRAAGGQVEVLCLEAALRACDQRQSRICAQICPELGRAAFGPLSCVSRASAKAQQPGLTDPGSAWRCLQ